jgi:putative transposase
VRTEEQLLHLSRYIHLNPYSTSIVKNLDVLYKYEWSSLKEYVGVEENPVCEKEMILSYFKAKENYKNFIANHAEYQRELKLIENLIFE